MLPVVFLLVLLLIQPGIVLYDRMVMAQAAAETARLVAGGDIDESSCKTFALNRLGGIPPLDLFHVHESGCSYEVKITGSAASDVVSVTISTELTPLPVLDGASALLGLVNARGNLVVEVTVEVPTRASWAQTSLGGSTPSEKVGDWCDEV